LDTSSVYLITLRKVSVLITPQHYDPTDYERALVKVREWGEHIPIGVCYQVNRPSRKDRLYTTSSV
jgi:hypothetical protein